MLYSTLILFYVDPVVKCQKDVKAQHAKKKALSTSWPVPKKWPMSLVEMLITDGVFLQYNNFINYIEEQQ